MMNVVINHQHPLLYRGEDCTDKLVEELSKIKDEVKERANCEDKPMEEPTEERYSKMPQGVSMCKETSKKMIIVIFLVMTVVAHM